MRSSSWSSTLVRVTKFPIIRDNRQSSSFTYRDFRSPGAHLVNKAENAVVFAHAGIAQHGIAKGNTQGFVVLLMDGVADDPPVPANHLQHARALRGQGLIINLVNQRLTVDLCQGVPFPQSQPVGNAPFSIRRISCAKFPSPFLSGEGKHSLPRIMPIIGENMPNVKPRPVCKAHRKRTWTIWPSRSRNGWSIISGSGLWAWAPGDSGYGGA